jgi:hypothetical protein
MLSDDSHSSARRSSKVSKIEVTCPECQARLALARPAPGKKIRCPKCEAIFAPNPGAAAAALTTARRPDRPRCRRPPAKKEGIPTGAAIATIAASVLLLAGAGAAIVMHSKLPGPNPFKSGSGGGPRIVGGPRIIGGPVVAQTDSSPKVGQVAPEIEAEDIDGIPFKLSDYRGKVVVLDFWGHW